jgi:hypothetical protein
MATLIFDQQVRRQMHTQRLTRVHAFTAFDSEEKIVGAAGMPILARSVAGTRTIWLLYQAVGADQFNVICCWATPPDATSFL